MRSQKPGIGPIGMVINKDVAAGAIQIKGIDSRLQLHAPVLTSITSYE